MTEPPPNDADYALIEKLRKYLPSEPHPLDVVEMPATMLVRLLFLAGQGVALHQELNNGG